jgi:4-hydroxyphenylacetate 3-monooxygenase
MTRTGADYLASLDDGRQVLLDGRPVDDVAGHPAFAGAARSVAGLYDREADPANAGVLTFPSPADGQPVPMAWKTPRSVADLADRRRAATAVAEATFGLMGRSPDHVASFFAGFVASPATYAGTGRDGRALYDNLAAFAAKARDEHAYLSYTIIHPTIDRAKPPHEQYDDHLYVSVAGERDDGLVLRGAQMLGTGSVLSDYVFVSCILPLPPGAEDYALSVVVPNNAPGLRIHTRRPYALGAPSPFDYPLSTRFDETDSLVVFDDVLVPWEHVFAYRDIEAVRAQFQATAAHSLGNTQAQTRFAVKMRLIAGLARRLCDDAGTSVDGKTRQRLGVIAAHASVPEAFLLAAEAGATVDAEGVARPDPGMLYTAMTLQPQLATEINRLVRELAGGSVIQLPSSVAAFGEAVSAGDLDRFVRWPNATAVERIKLLKLVWDAVGSEFAGRHLQYEMFYAGDPSVVQMRAFGGYGWDRAGALVDACLAGVPDPVPALAPAAGELAGASS